MFVSASAGKQKDPSPHHGDDGHRNFKNFLPLKTPLRKIYHLQVFFRTSVLKALQAQTTRSRNDERDQRTAQPTNSISAEEHQQQPTRRTSSLRQDQYHYESRLILIQTQTNTYQSLDNEPRRTVSIPPNGRRPPAAIASSSKPTPTGYCRSKGG